MFANKIKLTDAYIDLIVKMRKSHNLTAYHLSEKIGKNKSWLPNIENHRTKSISKDDLFLLFKDFAAEENLDPEKFIIKYLAPDTPIELEDKTTVPCHFLQTKLELLSLESNPHEYLENYNFYRNELPKQNDLEYSSLKLNDLIEILSNELKSATQNERQILLNTIDVMIDNFMMDPYLTSKIYGSRIVCINSGLGYDEKQISYFNNKVTNIINNYRTEMELCEKESALEYYFSQSNTGVSFLTEVYDISLHSTYEEIMEWILSVEKYISKAFSYLRIACSNKVEFDYNKYILKPISCLRFFLEKMNIKYDFKLNTLTNKSSLDEINQEQINLNNILLKIKELVSSRYKKA